MIDTANGGALMDKTPVAVRYLIFNIASNTQQFGIRGAAPSRMVNEIGAVDNLRLENQLIELPMVSNTQQFGIRGATPSRIVNEIGAVDNLRLENQLIELTSLVDISTESSRIKVGHMIVNNLEGSSTGQIRVKGNTQLQNSNPARACLKVKIPTAIVPTAVAIESATTRQLTISGGLDEQKPRPVDAESEPKADSLVPQQARSTPLPFPTETLSARKAKSDKDLLTMF
ncbi:hypothetical protein CR513_21949, partial [Mucuna pruriens]